MSTEPLSSETCVCPDFAEHVPQSLLVPTICREFKDNDQGYCMECHHMKECHDNP